MAPAKVTGAAKAAPAQRSIASFFGSAPKKQSSPKQTLHKKTKQILAIPAEGDEIKPHSSAKRKPAAAVKENPELEDEKKILLTSSPTSPKSSPGEKTGEITKKSKDWISTPSPCEQAKPTTKFFGRRSKKTSNSGAPINSSTDDHPSDRLTKAGGTDEKGANPESFIGKKLQVFWPLDKVWYSGRVKSYNNASGSHNVRYDDGEVESIVLGNEKIRWLDEVAASQALQKPVAKQTETSKRTRESSKRRSSPNLKRKRVVDDDEDDELEDSLLDELKNEGDEVQSDGSNKKRARKDSVEEDSPAKVLPVSADVYDEVDIGVPRQDEEVKVRKRLRKVVGRAPEKTSGDVEEVDKEEYKAGKRTLRSSGTSARRLQLEDAADEDESAPTKGSPKQDDDSLDESFNPATGESDSECEQTSAKKKSQKTASASRKPSLGSTKSQPSNFFSKLGVKSVKSAPAAVSGSVRRSLSPLNDGSSETPKVLEADILTKGELHSTLVGEACERFGGRLGEKFKFLGKGRKDACGRRPSDPDYDHRTVHLPLDFLKGLSGGQRQWWELKAKNMDKVLLFKMGKFYEMFEMDAHVGAQELDLQYMKGDQPHCGFPEKLYFENAEKLARNGYRVLVVEQTETPDQLDQRRRETGSKDKVVRREVCAIITKGTIVDGEMLEACPDPAYLMSITEMAPAFSEDSATSEKEATIGVCFVDTSTSHVMVGQFDDDAARSSLRSVLSELRPVELIKPRGVLTEATERAIKDHTRQPLINSLAPGQEFWDALRTREEILEMYSRFNRETKPSSRTTMKKKTTESDAELLQMLPTVLRLFVEADSRCDAALSAIGGCIFYLRQALLDQTILKVGRIELLPGSYGVSTADALADKSKQEESEVGAEELKGRPSGTAALQFEPYMLLDSAALENLEIIENIRDGGTAGTLLAHFDSCATPYGRRLLKQWLVRPLLRVEPILLRQQAVVDLQGVAAEAAINFRKELRGQADMERLLARLHASSGACGRNADCVVLYEDAARKQLHELLAALSGCRALLRALKCFENCLSELTSERLRELVTPGLKVPDMTSILQHFEGAFDREEAERNGRIVPNEGVDVSFDEADAAVNTATQELDDYLVKQRKKFGNSSEINYVTVGKERFQIEIPEEYHTEVSKSYEVKSSRKGFRRYWTPEIKSLLQDLTSGEQQRELALRGILQGLVRRFCEDFSNWLALVKSVAEVDVLTSLSEASVHSGQTCRPTFVTDSVKIEAKGIRHPLVCLNLPGGGAFVPNDVALGGVEPPFMLLTGPNMGGKSTLIRQTCLAVVSAQVGANVAADEFQLSPVDRVFVRMGAKDHIMAGQSTFLVELSETATMLRSASRNSLVALDELGRGTSTADGQAIAHAVLEHLAHNVGCRGMFSTHYHRLASNFASDTKVGLHHMSCKVDVGADGLEEVVFLYKLAAGACPKSYGVNVARLAGMPDSVLRRATEKAEELELQWRMTTNRNSQADSKDSTLCESSYDADTGSETENKFVEEVVSLVKKIPDDESDLEHSSLLLLWQEAKRLWENLGESGQQSIEVE